MRVSAGLGAVLAALLLSGVLIAADADSFVVTAASVEALRGNLRSVRPPLPAGSAVAGYLSPGGCLGSLGPLGAYGPLGMLGPIGSNLWNPSSMMAVMRDWSGLSRFLTLRGGPMSADGPLGPQGPLGRRGRSAWLTGLGDLGPQLAAGGPFGILGPEGPLGVLGPLGPLGPVGGHGLAPDAAGHYRRGARIARVVEVPIGGIDRRFELVEQYAEAVARSLPDNDTSFLVRGDIAARGEIDSYEFRSRWSQTVSVTVIPEKALDGFGLELEDGAGRRLAVSDSRCFVNWIVTEAERGGRLRARVRLLGSAQFTSKSYRLIVVGAGAGSGWADVTGAHQIPIH